MNNNYRNNRLSESKGSYQQRRRPRAGGYNNRDIVTKAQVRDMLRTAQAKSESKHFIDSWTSVSVSTLGTFHQVSAIPQGIGDGTRVGDEARIIDLTWHFTFTAGDPTNIWRFVVFQWNSILASGAFPTLPNIFFDSSSVNILESCFNQDNIDGGVLHIIHDEKILLDTVAHPLRQSNWDKYTNLRKHLQYNAAGTGGSDSQVFIVMITDSSAAPHPFCTGQTMLRFNDN